MKLQAFGLIYFLGKFFFGDDDFQNISVYRCTEYVIGWKLKGVYTSKLIPLYTASFHNIKRFIYKIGIQFKKSVFVVK